VSGGKDSQATLELALKDSRGLEVIPVFYETGWDHPLTYRHLEKMMTFYGLKLCRTHYKEAPTMEALIKKKGFFPNGGARFCTGKFKQEAFKRWLNKIEECGEIWLGIRSNESQERKKRYGELDDTELYEMDDVFPGLYNSWTKHRFKFRLPVLNLTTEDVFLIIKDSGLAHNPLYDIGFDRVGCFPCLCAGKKTQRLAYSTPFGKYQYEVIQYLEYWTGQKFKMSREELATCSVCKI
jgi:3'-phosphoadenosine 5'-phosphosulfate sulfotransferase (PAPS reductase)/FAD synthetase